MFVPERKSKEAANESLPTIGHGNSNWKGGTSMTNSRTNARIAGILLILGTVPMITALLLWGQPLMSPDYLSSMAANSSKILLFALTVMVMGLACAGIGISLYPVLKSHNEGLALAATGFRLMEGTLQVASAVGFFALLTVSREFVKAGNPIDSFYQPAGALLKALNNWVGNTYFLPFSIGASIYYAIFYRTRLVPRWLSVWGLVGSLGTLVSNFAGIFGLIDDSTPVSTLLSMPILVQELVLAVWLIVKGFDSPAAAKERVI
jgi:hypothetical protein